MPVTAPSNRPSTTRIPSTLSSAATKCISDVPGLPKQTSTPDPTSVRRRLSAPFMLFPLRQYASHESTQSRDRLADDQGVHFPCALVGVDRFGISHEAADVVLEQDTVATEQLARIANGLTAFDRAERLRERRMFIAHHTFVLK